jgi:hypothetical protein
MVTGSEDSAMLAQHRGSNHLEVGSGSVIRRCRIG